MPAGLSPQGVSSSVTNAMEGLVEVLARLFMNQPHAFTQLLDNDSAAMLQYIDRWLVIAGTHFLEEAIGVKTMAMLGRFRRRIAACALCALVSAEVALPAITASDKVARMAHLCARSAAEDREFRADAQELDTMDFKTDLGEDYVLAKRLEISASDPIRSVDAPALYRTTLQKVAGLLGGEQVLLGNCSHISTHLPKKVENLLHSG